jgi:hypothetical protein
MPAPDSTPAAGIRRMTAAWTSTTRLAREQRVVTLRFHAAIKPRDTHMDTTTLLIMIIVVLILLGGGWYGRGRWY